MRMAYELCLATAGKQVPDGPDEIHEVKHDGYRMLVIREGDRVRLLSRNGADWTKRYPWVAEAALPNREKHFVIDGEAVVLDVDMIPISMLCTLASGSTRCSSTPSTCWWRWGRPAPSRSSPPQDEPPAAAVAPAGRHHHCAVRARRDRPRPILRRLPDGAGRAGVEASRLAVLRRSTEALGSGEEPKPSAMSREL